jgi:uncharacterized coiled-coil protein SlyX
MNDRISKLEAELNRANASGQAGHQTLMEALSNFLNARTENVLLADQMRTTQQQLSAQLAAKQAIIDAMQGQVVELTAEVKSWEDKIGVVIDAEPEKVA